MGSPLSPALCLMVVALLEEVWHRTFQSALSTMNLTLRLLRCVDNRLCLIDSHWFDDPAFATFLHPEFYGSPIFLEIEPDQEFLGFCIEFEPFALRYSPPQDINQVMAPFSASPLSVQLSDLSWRPVLQPLPPFRTPLSNNSFMTYTTLILRRAMSIIRPTLIPNLEPMQFPSPGSLAQTDGFQPQERFCLYGN